MPCQLVSCWWIHSKTKLYFITNQSLHKILITFERDSNGTDSDEDA